MLDEYTRQKRAAVACAKLHHLNVLAHDIAKEFGLHCEVLIQAPGNGQRRLKVRVGGQSLSPVYPNMNDSQLRRQIERVARNVHK